MSFEIDDLAGTAKSVLLEPPLEEDQLRDFFILIGMDTPSRIESLRAISASRIEDSGLSEATREEAKRQLEAVPRL